MDKSFSIDVSLEKFSNTIEDKIIASLDTTGKCPTVNDDGSIDVTSEEDENSLLCSAPDNYGISYYFRGNVTNNYVYFSGYYWRIVRINGDGSIRLIYDGTTIHENGEASEDRIIGTSAFNESYDDNAYVGYMYGTPGSSSYTETHKNINDSTIKKYIDTWYENNLLNTEYEQYLKDNIFCNDRSISTGLPDGYSNKGYGKEKTAYRWLYGFLYNPNGDENPYEKLTCPQQNDAFTVNDTTSGNGSLKYPIGLLSTDEVVLGGGWRSEISNYYLYTGTDYWQMTPGDFFGTSSVVRFIRANGYAKDGLDIFKESGVKPVINLKYNALKSGLGTIESPYLTTK